VRLPRGSAGVTLALEHTNLVPIYNSSEESIRKKVTLPFVIIQFRNSVFALVYWDIVRMVRSKERGILVEKEARHGQLYDGACLSSTTD
jgi:hypothetical protein